MKHVMYRKPDERAWAFSRAMTPDEADSYVRRLRRLGYYAHTVTAMT